MNKLFELCKKEGISGFEFEIGKYVRTLFAQHCIETEIDALGNVIGILNKGKKPKIMLEAHLDEIGLMVKNIDENGFISFVEIGGVDAAILPSLEVYVHGKEQIFGVIGAKPPHLQEKDESEKTYKIENLFIDTGYNLEEIKKLVNIGDAITFSAKSTQLMGGKIATKSIDNRMGVYVLVECLKRLKNQNIDAEVVALASVQEEVGCRGAKVGAYKIEPDCAIIIDVTHGVSPYTTSTEGFELGSGVAIAVGPNLHPELTQKMIDVAENNKIPYTIEVCAGHSGTDAWQIQISKKGIPCILVSTPLRYMHTSVETVQMSDIDAVINIICKLIEGGGVC